MLHARGGTDVAVHFPVTMDRCSSLLDVFPVVVVSAKSAGAARSKRPQLYRSELMLMQLRHGKTPSAELVVTDGARGDLRAILPPRGQRARHASYRVTQLEGSVLHTRALLPRKRGMRRFRMRVRYPDGSVDRLLPVEADGLVTEIPLAVRVQRGRTVIEIEGAGRIDLIWDG